MLILPEFAKPYIIESTNSPVIAKYYWAFSASMLDYTLLPITYLEEYTGPAIKLDIDGLEFLVPYNWHIMISDPDTLSLDYMPIIDCATTVSYALTMNPVDGKFRLANIKINGIVEDVALVYPMLQKTIAMCYPINEIETDLKVKTISCIVIGPHDLYKHIAGKLYGDLI